MKRFISLNDFRARLSIGRTTFWRLQNTDPDFPPAVQVSPGRLGFREEDVDRYMAERPLKRSAAHLVSG